MIRCCFGDPPEAFEVLIEVAGFRHEAEREARELRERETVQFVPEPENLIDSRAIRMESAGQKLGYVPRGHPDMLHRMLLEGAGLEGEAFRINGTSERPLVYVLTRISQEPYTLPSHALRMQA